MKKFKLKLKNPARELGGKFYIGMRLLGGHLGQIPLGTVKRRL